MSVSLCRATPGDEDFMFEVYASTRADEMALVDWSDEQKQAFLRMQFNAQRLSYQQQFPEAEYQLILHGDARAGRLIVDRSSSTILLIDIAVIPEFRNLGIGSSLIKDLKTESANAQKPLRLHVENFNPAFRLYERLGFTKVDEFGFYWRMEWHPKVTVESVGVS